MIPVLQRVRRITNIESTTTTKVKYHLILIALLILSFDIFLIVPTSLNTKGSNRQIFMASPVELSIVPVTGLNFLNKNN